MINRIALLPDKRMDFETYCYIRIPHKVNHKKVLNVIPNHLPKTMGVGCEN